MLVLTESGWLLDGVPTELASWFPQQRVATINENINTNISITIDSIFLNGNSYSVRGTQVNAGINLDNRRNIFITDLEVVNFSTGINIRNCTSIIIENLEIKDNSIGIMLDAANDCIVKKCMVRNSSTYGIRMIDSNRNIICNSLIDMTPRLAAGISMERVSNNSIIDSQLNNNETAMELLYDCSDNLIYRNSFEDNEFSLTLFSGPDNTIIEENYFVRDGTVGISIFNICFNNIMMNNDFENSELGIIIQQLSNDNRIEENNIRAVQTGITNVESNRTAIIRNTICTQDGQGIMIVSGANLDIRDNIISMCSEEVLGQSDEIKYISEKLIELYKKNSTTQ